MTKMAVKQHQKDHGHQLCKPLIEHEADGGCVSLFMHSPSRFLASKYSFFQPSRSSAESLYHCLKNVRTKSMHESLNKWGIEIWKKIACTRDFSSGMFEDDNQFTLVWNSNNWTGVVRFYMVYINPSIKMVKPPSMDGYCLKIWFLTSD